MLQDLLLLLREWLHSAARCACARASVCVCYIHLKHTVPHGFILSLSHLSIYLAVCLSVSLCQSHGYIFCNKKFIIHLFSLRMKKK